MSQKPGATTSPVASTTRPERAAEMYRWIEKGAAIYVCGDARRMAKDVHEALIAVLETQGQLKRADAELRLKELRGAGRYQRDVY